jgi:hypothetical protein
MPEEVEAAPVVRPDLLAAARHLLGVEETPEVVPAGAEAR